MLHLSHARTHAREYNDVIAAQLLAHACSHRLLKYVNWSRERVVRLQLISKRIDLGSSGTDRLHTRTLKPPKAGVSSTSRFIDTFMQPHSRSSAFRSQAWVVVEILVMVRGERLGISNGEELRIAGMILEVRAGSAVNQARENK